MILNNYDDIIDYNWMGSPNREKMPLSARAKIFAPFSPLTGLDELLKKTSKDVEKSHT